MELNWKHHEDRWEWEATTDYGVFRIALCVDETYTLAGSDAECGIDSRQIHTLEFAKMLCHLRCEKLMRQEAKWRK